MNNLGQLIIVGVLVATVHVGATNAATCEGTLSNGVCSDSPCDENGCNCEIDTASNITSCNQHCSINATDCPLMKCYGMANKGSSCEQYCRDNKGRCKMSCWNVPECIQECSPDISGGCDYIRCAADKCLQSCANCTMECTKEVKECDQRCQKGTCISKCAAETCKLDCSGAKCEKLPVEETNGNANSTASHMQLGGHFAKPILPAFCLIMAIFW